MIAQGGATPQYSLAGKAGTLAALRRPALHLWWLGTGSSRFARKKFPAAFSLRVKKFPVFMLVRRGSSRKSGGEPGVLEGVFMAVVCFLGLRTSQFEIFNVHSGVRAPALRPPPQSSPADGRGGRSRQERREQSPAPVVGMLGPRLDDSPTLYCNAFGCVGEGASVVGNCSALMRGMPAESVDNDLGQRSTVLWAAPLVETDLINSEQLLAGGCFRPPPPAGEGISLRFALGFRRRALEVRGAG